MLLSQQELQQALRFLQDSSVFSMTGVSITTNPFLVSWYDMNSFTSSNLWMLQFVIDQIEFSNIHCDSWIRTLCFIKCTRNIPKHLLVSITSFIHSLDISDFQKRIPISSECLILNSLYTHTDITLGDNRCTEGYCCPFGYGATKGWDAVVCFMDILI